MFAPLATANIDSRGKNRIHLVQTQESQKVLGDWKGKTHPSQGSAIDRIERWLTVQASVCLAGVEISNTLEETIIIWRKLSTFTHYVVPKPYDFPSSVEQERSFEKCLPFS